MPRAPFERGMRLDDGGKMVVSKEEITETKPDSFDDAISNIKALVEASKKAREERQAAAEKRKEELAKARLENFTPLYDRIDKARVNVELIKANLEELKTKTVEVSSNNAATSNPTTSNDNTTSTTTSPITLTTSLLPDTSYTPPAYTPPPPATPVVPPAPPPPPPPPPKTAPIDTVLFDFEDQPFEIMQDLLLEDIGGHELINIARNDTINGQTVTYQPIKNLTSIQQQYNPNNVVALQNTSDKYFANFSIKLETKLPEEGNGPDAAYVYIEDATGDLIIELINLDPDEQIEVQISLSGTIYEAEFNES